jgi:hypothetical protein
VATPQRGQIVLARVLDPQKRNEKLRPLVIVTASEKILPGQPFLTVAITGTFEFPLPEDCVELPWGPKGRCRTGLTKKAVAVCSWLEQITEDDIESNQGVVPPHEMLEILEKVKHLVD